MIFTTIEKVEGSPGLVLQELSSAQVMVSSFKAPPSSRRMIENHVGRGAFLYRVVTFTELKNIERGTLLSDLEKMRSFGGKPNQNILLLDSSHEILDWDSFIVKVNDWINHGGVFIHTFGNTVASIIKHRNDNITEDENATRLYPIIPGKPIEKVYDWRITLATFPRIGYSGAENVRIQMMRLRIADTLFEALQFMTSSTIKEDDPQWIQARKICRSWMGLPDGFDLDLKFIGDVTGSSEEK